MSFPSSRRDDENIYAIGQRKQATSSSDYFLYRLRERVRAFKPTEPMKRSDDEDYLQSKLRHDELLKKATSKNRITTRSDNLRVVHGTGAPVMIEPSPVLASANQREGGEVSVTTNDKPTGLFPAQPSSVRPSKRIRASRRHRESAVNRVSKRVLKTRFRSKPPNELVYSFNQYTYKKLGELKHDDKRVNVWGIVYDVVSDASVCNEPNPRWHINTKLIDDTIYPGCGRCDYVPLTMYFKNSPSLHTRIEPGCIIRIHRGDVRAYDGGIQLNCDESIKASWVVFSYDKGTKFEPLAHDKQAFSWGERDESRLTELRQYVRKLLKVIKEARDRRIPPDMVPVRALPEHSKWYIMARGPNTRKSLYKVRNIETNDVRSVYADGPLKALAKNYNYFVIDGVALGPSRNRVSILTPMTDVQGEAYSKIAHGDGMTTDL